MTDNAPLTESGGSPYVDLTDDWPSLEVVYDWAKLRAGEQISTVSELDRKAAASLGSAGLVTAGVAALVSTVNSSLAPNGRLGTIWIPFWDHNVRASVLISIACVLAGISLVAVVVCSYQALKLRKFRVAPTLERLRPYYLYQDPKLTKAAITEELCDCYFENSDELDRKVSWVDRSIRSVVFQFFVAILVIGIQIWIVLGASNDRQTQAGSAPATPATSQPEATP